MICIMLKYRWLKDPKIKINVTNQLKMVNNG